MSKFDLVSKKINRVNREIFKDFLYQIEPIEMFEPLAETLGAFNNGNPALSYSYIDVVKMAGHACPTTAGAFVCCKKALEKLFPGKTPIRGDISITIYGEQDEGVYGVIGQVFNLLTGAAPASGFSGLGHKFRRKDLLKFTPQKIDPEAMCFEFRRIDNNQGMLVKFYPQNIPVPQGKAEKLAELMPKVLWEVANENERNEFQNLWMERVKNILIDQKEIDNWLIIEKLE
ncbi:MAG TPA: hypothetical protein ENN22_03235 [bacterium]|nr:hypothetical protein [bacterium]